MAVPRVTLAAARLPPREPSDGPAHSPAPSTNESRLQSRPAELRPRRHKPIAGLEAFARFAAFGSAHRIAHCQDGPRRKSSRTPRRPSQKAIQRRLLAYLAEGRDRV